MAMVVRRRITKKIIASTSVMALWLGVGSPGVAAGWTATDLTAAAAGSLVAPSGRSTSAYTTNLAGQGPVARVVYLNTANHVEELSSAGGEVWRKADLTELTGAPVGREPFGYTSNLDGQGPVARVVYSTYTGRIVELSLGAGGAWQRTDLTQATGAPHSNSNPFGYTTILANQRPMARVVYNSGSSVIELSLVGGGTWKAANLTALAGAPSAGNGSPAAFTTDLPGQGPAARVLYRTFSGRLEQLSFQTGDRWRATDMITVANAPPISGFDMFGYQTNLTGQGPVARILYQTYGGHIIDISASFGQPWRAANLSAISGAIGSGGHAFAKGYQTDIPGEGTRAHVTFRNNKAHIVDISVALGQQWGSTKDLTVLGAGSTASAGPTVYMTTLAGQGQVTRLAYRTIGAHVEELRL